VIMSAQTKQTVKQASMERDGQHDFDFQFGSWKAHDRRLLRPLTGSDEWVEFEGTIVAKPLWGGLGNMDEFDGESPSGRIRGLTVRLYNPKTREWSIYWANQSNGAFTLPPVVGKFDGNGVGEFYDHELLEGRAIFCRYLWKVLSSDSVQWEQAFSVDGGRTWETNWIIKATRITP
jgi:hypothetical protein